MIPHIVEDKRRLPTYDLTMKVLFFLIVAVYCCSISAQVCNQVMDIGPCDGSFKRFYYDIVSSKCKEFFFGGCGGNNNNFKTYDDCVKHCEHQNVCQQPKVVGPCEALFTRYYFNSLTNQCEKFYYGGCLGNGNNFRQFTDCMTTCMPNHKGK